MDNNSPSPSISIKPKDSTIDSKFGVVVTTPNYLQFFSDVPSYYQFLKDPKNYKDLLLGTVNIGNLIRNYLFINPEFKQLVRDIVSDIEIPSIDTDTIVTIEGEQEVKGRKDFTGGLAVNGQNLIYDPVKKAWQLTGDLVVTGAVTMFGSLSGFTPSTVTDAVLVDGKTIVKTKNSQGQWQLTATGGGGGEGGGLTSDEVNILIAKALSPVNKNLATKWTQDDTKITNWDSAFKWGDHSKAGYMKSTDFDTQLKKYILKDTVEQISARHNFTDGLQIAGINIYKSQDKTIYLDANLVVSGAFAMFGKNSTTFETIWKDIPFDDTMEWTGSVWRVNYDGIGSLDTNAVNVLISKYLNRTGEEYAKQSWVNQQGFAKQSALTAVDNRLSAVETFFATEDSDTLINKWSEIVAFLNATEGDTLDNILATKANQSALDAAVASLTTEIGKKWTQNDAKISNWDSAYGWGNHANAGYAAKTYVDAELAKYVKLATAQKIDAQHNFVNGLQIGGLPITKSASANNTIYLDANLVVSGAITMFGSGSTTFPTIWANIPFNLEQMSWDGSQWNIKGGGGSGSLDTNAVNVLIYEYLTQNSYATISDISSSLAGYATQSWVSDNYLSKSGGIVSGSFRAFEVKRTDEIGSFVSFSNYTGYMGSLGFRNTDMPGFFDSAGGAYFLIHSNNIGDYALPLTGGTVNGSVTIAEANWANQLHLKTSSPACGIRFYIDDVTKGILQTNRDGVLQWETDVYNTILHSGNYSSYALPITGGVIEAGAGNYTPLTIKNQSMTETWIQFHDSVGVSFIGSSQGVPCVFLGSGGNNAILHSGNIGSYNAGSATRLQTPRTIWGQSFDGTSDISGALSQVSWINFSNTDWGIYSGPTFGSHLSVNDIVVYSEFIGLTGKVAVGGTTADEKLHVHGNVKAGTFIGDLNGYADSAGRLTAIRYSGDINANDLYYGTSYVMRLSENVNLPSDMHYGNILYIGGADTGFMLAGSYGHDKLLFRRGINAHAANQTINTNAWKQIAFTDSNVASATKLEVSQRLWGKPFDGTNSIDGDIFPSSSGCYFNINGISQHSNYGWIRDVLLVDSLGNISVVGNITVHGSAIVTSILTVAANVQIPANGDRITFNSVSGTYTKGVLAMNANNTYFEAPLSSDSKTASKPPIMIGWTDGTYPIYINPNTNIAIGGTTADAKLDIYGNVKAAYYLTRGGGSEGLWQGSQFTSALGANDVLVYGNTVALFNKVAIGRWTASATLHVGGDIIADGVITMFSQLSMKNVIDYDGLSLEQLAQIKPARFTWKDGRDTLVHAGGIADEVMRVLPEVVHRTKDDKLTMDYGSAAFFIATSLIKPVIELWEVKDKQQEEIESLKKRVEHLENENRQLRAS